MGRKCRTELPSTLDAIVARIDELLRIRARWSSRAVRAATNGRRGRAEEDRHELEGMAEAALFDGLCSGVRDSSRVQRSS